MAIENTTTAKAVTSGTQLSSVGTVKTIVGLVKAVDANGTERVLQVGDKVFANETIITSADGGVIIEFPNGSHLDLPRSAHIMLDPEIYAATAGKSIEQEASDEAARIARAIAEGRDPNAVADPAAAGGETGDEGTTTPLVVDFDNTQGNVTSGYPTGPISLSFPPPQEELPPLEPVVAVIPNNPPDIEITLPSAIDVNPGIVNEKGLAEGGSGEVADGDTSNDSDTSEKAINGTITVSDPDGLGDIQTITIGGVPFDVGTDGLASLVGGTINGLYGILTITGYDGNGTFTYDYELTKTTEDQVPGDPNPAETDSFIVTVSDGKAAPASATITIEIVDDVPAIEEADDATDSDVLLTPDSGGTDSKDFSDAFTFTVTPGADGQASLTTAYTLSLAAANVNLDGVPGNDHLDSGLKTSDTNSPIYLYLVGNVVVGSTSETAPVAPVDPATWADVTDVVFTLEVDGSGEVTLNQYEAIEHVVSGDPADDGPEDGSDDGDFTDDLETLATGLVTLTATQTVEDNDGDTATASSELDLGGKVSFSDVGPTATGAEYTRLDSQPVPVSVVGDLYYVPGADGLQSVTFEYANFSDGLSDSTGLIATDANGAVLKTIDGYTIYLAVDDGNGGYDMFGDGVGEVSSTTQLVGIYQDANNVWHEAFTLTLNGDTYTMEMEVVLSASVSEITVDLTGGISGGNDGSYNIGVVKDGNGAVENGDILDNILATALGSAETINSRNGGLGAGIKGGGDSSLFIHFVQGAQLTGQDTNTKNDDTYEILPEGVSFNFVGEWNGTTYVGTRTVNDVTVTMGATQSGGANEVRIYLYDANGDLVDITGVTTSGGTLPFDDGTSWTVGGLTVGETFTVTGETDFTTIEVWYESGSGFLLSNISYNIETTGSSVDLAYDYTVTDNDGDTSVGQIALSVDPDAHHLGAADDNYTVTSTVGEIVYGDGGSDTITGGSGDDILYGGVENDILNGMAGDDILTGGSGSDTFLWNSGDTGADQVTDFVVGAAGDILDISDLLTDGLTMSAASVDGHLQLQFTNATDTVVQTIDLNNIAAADATAATNLMNQLLLSGNIDDGV